MFRQLRRKDKQLSQEKTKKILYAGEYGILGTTGEDGYPYTVPLNYVYTPSGIYFHCAQEGHKLDNIRYNNKVSFTVVNSCRIMASKFSTEYESVIIFGRILTVKGEEKKEALKQIIYKYSPEYEESGIKYIENSCEETEVLKIEIEHLSGKGNGSQGNRG